MSITFRPACPEDEPFLFEVYCSSRNDELAGGDQNSPQLALLLKMQFLAQQGTYDVQYPTADHDIILLEGKPIGRVMVERGDEENRGVDIALLPAYRSTGIGGAIIQELLNEAGRAGKPFRIHVVKGNRAKHLYDRLGFREVGETDTHFFMEWTANE